MNRTVGIDAIATYVPKLCVDLTGEWASVRAAQAGEKSTESLREKVSRGIGVREMAIPDYHEDAATMAAMAALKLIQEQNIDPAQIGSIAIGTETSVDQSKAISAYVLGMLERHFKRRLPNVGAPQVQFACIGATYALEAVVNQIRCGDNSAPYGLVIGTDISKYPLRSAGECTQGAGAVALLISEAPRLLELEVGTTGTASRDERDFFRPNWSRTAVVDGKYSIDVYLDLIEAAWNHRTLRLAARGGAFASPPESYDDFDYFLFHTPFPRMAEYAAGRVFRTLWQSDPDRQRALREAELTQDLEPRDLEKRFRATDVFKREFANKVEPTLALARRVGNVYSASLYLSLASLIATKEANELAGRRALFFSYGSGASAKVISGRFTQRCGEVMTMAKFADSLRTTTGGGSRISLSMAQYEEIHRFREYRLDVPDSVLNRLRRGDSLEDQDRATILRVLEGEAIQIVDPPPSIVAPRGEFVLSRISRGLEPGVNDAGYRYYDWVTPLAGQKRVPTEKTHPGATASSTTGLVDYEESVTAVGGAPTVAA